ncbi:MAG: ATP-binding protein, partial [Pseudomonadota bacterium]
LLIEHEIVDRQSHRLAQRLRRTRLPQSATLEDLDLRTPRGLDRAALRQIASLAWIDQHAATPIASQLPVDQWHAYLGNPTLADAILDRLVHHAQRLVLSGESMRKQRRDATRNPPPSSSAG